MTEEESDIYTLTEESDIYTLTEEYLKIAETLPSFPSRMGWGELPRIEDEVNSTKDGGLE